MANTAKVLFRGAASLANTTLYTTPSLTTTVVTNILVANTSSSSQTFTIKLDGISIMETTTIAANSVVGFDMKQVLIATDLIQGSASAITVNFHISGMEIV